MDKEADVVAISKGLQDVSRKRKAGRMPKKIEIWIPSPVSNAALKIVNHFARPSGNQSGIDLVKVWLTTKDILDKFAEKLEERLKPIEEESERARIQQRQIAKTLEKFAITLKGETGEALRPVEERLIKNRPTRGLLAVAEITRWPVRDWRDRMSALVKISNEAKQWLESCGAADFAVPLKVFAEDCIADNTLADLAALPALNRDRKVAELEAEQQRLERKLEELTLRSKKARDDSEHEQTELK